MSKGTKDVFSRLFVLFVGICSSLKPVFFVTLDKIFDVKFYFPKIRIINVP